MGDDDDPEVRFNDAVGERQRRLEQSSAPATIACTVGAVP
jgi:hypothetical protein